jgi:5'-deoxynucleotidase YfbR-like HD superfamily hydrolase
MTPEQDSLWGLLHVAAEAHLGDLPAPIRREPEMQVYRAPKERLMAVVAAERSLPPGMPNSAQRSD